MKNRKLTACILAAMALGLVACSEPADITSKFDLPEGLGDCRAYILYTPNKQSPLYVLRCPNSSTTTSVKVGKSELSTTLINDNDQ